MEKNLNKRKETRKRALRTIQGQETVNNN